MRDKKQKTEYRIYYRDGDIDNVNRYPATFDKKEIVAISKVVRIYRNDGEQLTYQETFLYERQNQQGTL